MKHVRLFSLQFQPQPQGCTALYYRGSASAENGALSFRQGETVSFDTYFNLFSHAKYAKYCDVTAVTLTLRGRGKFRAALYHQPEKGAPLLLSEHIFTDTLSAAQDLSFLPQKGFVYFTLTSLSGGQLLSGAWEAQTPFVSPVKLGVVICTYHRETFVKENLARIRTALDSEPSRKEKLHFFVVDNAKSLALPAADFYTVLPNENLGGSGGFTRGIMEVCRQPSFTHFLLMDDDIFFRFETLEKTVSLFSILSPRYASAAVGGAMLTLDEPCRQHEQGALFTGAEILARHADLPLEDTASLLRNERENDSNFCGWWYCAMPVSAAKKFGLPMPFFIKADDVEYGIRCIKDLIFLNGIGIWHQDFTKKTSAPLEYYTSRNEQIVNAMHFKRRRIQSCKRLLRRTFRQLTLKKYESAELVLRAYRDFLQGTAFLRNADTQKLHAEICKSGEKILSKEELFNLCGLSESAFLQKLQKDKGKASFFKRAFAVFENFLPRFLFRKKPCVVDDACSHTQFCLLQKTVIRYNRQSQSGTVCCLDAKRRAKIKRQAFALAFKLFFLYPKLRRDYSENYRSVCSEEQWNASLFSKE